VVAGNTLFVPIYFQVKKKRKWCDFKEGEILASRTRTNMGALSLLALLFTHPIEFRTLLQYWFYHQQRRDIAAKQEHPTSGWDRKSMRRCWELLDLTSRSFSAVIKELDGDLARTVRCLFSVQRGASE
jgi:hypothetical protein